MAYDKDKPDDADLISDSAGDLRANFSAIQTGGVPYEKLECANTSPPGSGKADAIYVYGKDANSKAELHARDEDDNEIQLTSAGKIGSTSTNYSMGTYQFSEAGSDPTFGRDQQITAWIVFNSDGNATVNGKKNCTVVKDSNWNYTITFDSNVKDASSTDYCVIGTTANNAIVQVTSKSAGSFTVSTLSTTDSVQKEPVSVNIVVIGGQV